MKYQDYFSRRKLCELPKCRNKDKTYAKLCRRHPDLYIEELERSSRNLSTKAINKKRRHSVERDEPILCRIRMVRPDEGENFYFRILLQHVPAFSSEELKRSKA